MKKTYISPVSKCFAVNATEVIASSPLNQTDTPAVPGGGSDGSDNDVKGERGSGIWDLYN